MSQTANVTATFSEAVTGVSGTTFQLRLGTTLIPAVVSYNVLTRVATLNPSVTLTADRVYTASLSGIRDLAGNTMAPSTWTFHHGPGTHHHRHDSRRGSHRGAAQQQRDRHVQ